MRGCHSTAEQEASSYFLVKKQEEGMYMANQSLARRQSADVYVQQRPPVSLAQRTEAKLQAARSVVVTAAQVHDQVHCDLEAIARQGGRSPSHQRYMEQKLAYLRNTFDYHAQVVVRDALFHITQRSDPTLRW